MQMLLFLQRLSIQRFDLLKEVPNWKLKKDVIITDTGSTKGPIMEAAAPLIRTRNYIYWRTSNGGFP